MATQNDSAILNAIINPLFPIGEFIETEEAPETQCKENILSEDIKQAKELEKKGVELAEAGNLNEAVVQFEKAITIAPNWASAYNNRAQALRLAGRNNEALADLNNALVITKGSGKVAMQSFCQRAMLYELSCREDAVKDWEAAAKLGSTFAKNRLVQLNPYAALCNKMLHDVFKRLKEGQV